MAFHTLRSMAALEFLELAAVCQDPAIRRQLQRAARIAMRWDGETIGGHEDPPALGAGTAVTS